MTCIYNPLVFVVLVASMSAACTPDIHPPSAGIGDAALGDEPTDAGLDPRPSGYAVISGDYAVTSVGLLDRSGKLLERTFIDSGSASTGLVTALSGDVVVPSHPGDRGVLVLLDRFRTDVVTRVDLASGKVLGQVKTEDGDAADGFSSNPHDYVYLDAHEAWVSRYEPNPDAASDDPDRGCDLYRIDPTKFERGHERIDFWRWNTQGKRKNPDTGASDEITVYARPSSVVRVDQSHLVVGIDRFSLAFDAVADSVIALVDLTDKQVSVLPLPGLQSCGSLSPVPDDAARVIVGCTGSYRGVQRDVAGIAVVHYDGDRLRLERAWHAKDHPDSALTVSGVHALDATHVFAVAVGEKEQRQDGKLVKAETNDRWFRVDLESGAQTLVYEAGGRFVLGEASFDPRSGLVLLPDASTDDQGRPNAGVRRFQLGDDGALHAKDVIKLDPLLPARSVSLFE